MSKWKQCTVKIQSDIQMTLLKENKRETTHIINTMDNYATMYRTICRLCLNYGVSEKMVSLIDNNSLDGLSVHGKAVLNFAKVSLHKQDHLPNFMCIKCLHLLKQAIMFKFRCESSDKCLNELVAAGQKDIKEKVVEYTMLRFYFPNENLNTKKHVRKKNIKAPKTSNKNTSNEIKIKSDKQTSEFNFDDCHNSQSETENLADELLKMENLIEPNLPAAVLRKPLKRKLRRKRMEAKKQKIVAMELRSIQRNIQMGSLVCNICNKVLANQHTYDHHMQRHNGCRYICEHCGKGFPVRTELQIHQVSKHGTGPYIQCSHCPFKAPRKFDLMEHERIHSGERPYTCEKCGLTFRRRGIWRKHLIYHTEKKIQCQQCPKKFYQRSEMLAHANNVHDRMYVYLCSKCGATYAKTATVRRHMTERHGIPRELQGKVIRVNKGAGFQEQ